MTFLSETNLLEWLNSFGNNSWLKVGLVDGIITIALILLVSLLVNRLLTRLICKYVKQNEKFVLRIKTIVVTSFAVYGCLSIFPPFSSMMNALLASGGVVALIVGMGSQEAVGNLVNGAMITMFKPFKIGDLIKVNNGEIVGTVTDISLRHTEILTSENTKVIVPNTTINKAILENVSDAGDMKANFLELDISYERNLDLAMKIIEEEILKHPLYLDARSEEEKKNTPAVVTYLSDFLDSSIHLKTKVYSRNNAEGIALLSDLRIAIKKRFDEEGIEIPYPHRTIVNK